MFLPAPGEPAVGGLWLPLGVAMSVLFLSATTRVFMFTHPLLPLAGSPDYEYVGFLGKPQDWMALSPIHAEKSSPALLPT